MPGIDGVQPEHLKSRWNSSVLLLTVHVMHQHTAGCKCIPPSSALFSRCRLPHYCCLQRDLGGTVKASESYWTLEDGVLHFQLTKAEEGATWDSAIAGGCGKAREPRACCGRQISCTLDACLSCTRRLGSACSDLGASAVPHSR